MKKYRILFELFPADAHNMSIASAVEIEFTSADDSMTALRDAFSLLRKELGEVDVMYWNWLPLEEEYTDVSIQPPLFEYSDV